MLFNLRPLGRLPQNKAARVAIREEGIRQYLADHANATVERHGDYTYVITRGETSEYSRLTIFKGSSATPYVDYSYRTLERLDEAIASYKSSTDEYSAYRAEQKRLRQSAPNTLEVGDVLHYSWGYDQTNADFFQVIEKLPRSVKIREIASEGVGATGPMSGDVRPVKHKFVSDKVQTKIVKGDYVSMAHGIARKVSTQETFHSSWGH